MYASPKNFGQSSLNGIERKLREDSKFPSWRAINLFTSYNGLRVSIDSCFPASPFLTPHKSPPPRNSLPFSCLTTPDCLQFSFRIIRSFVWIRLPRNLNKFHLPSVPISTRDPESFKNLLSRPVFPRIYPSVFASAAMRIEHAAKKVRSIGARRNKRKKKKRKKKYVVKVIHWPTRVAVYFHQVRGFPRLRIIHDWNEEERTDTRARFDLKYQFYWPNSLSWRWMVWIKCLFSEKDSKHGRHVPFRELYFFSPR